MRADEVYRKTRETEVRVKVNLDAEGKASVNTGVSFLDHMITSLATHSLIDITATVKGDLRHHAVEDLAIGLGEALSKALDTREGITRFGYAAAPMDCSLAFAAVDLVKRPYFKIDLKLRGKKIEDMPTEDINHFFETLATSLQANVHVFVQYGSNDHHKAEAVIFDYGVGNLLSLKCALEKVGLNAKITVSAQQLRKADAIALPGVGNFSAAITKLDAVKEQLVAAVESGTPLLGICLGLQLFFQESEEGPGKGLALFEGKTVRLRGAVKVPHMGWNTLRIVKQNQFFEGVDDESYVYFVHSLYPMPVDKGIVAAETEYGTTFTSAIASKNVYGTQFHPEKSGDVGLKILSNFAKIVRR